MKSKRPFILSPGTGGVDRFDKGGKSVKLALGYDVINDDGDLRRRDGFRGVTVSPGFTLPAARTVVRYGADATGAAGTNATNRVGFAPSDGPYFFVGANVAFDGIDWPIHPTTQDGGVAPAANLRLVGHYWNGSAWTSIPWLHDSTRGKQTGSAASYEPFMRAGHIAWHRGQLTGWATVAIGGNTLFWVRLTLTNGAGTATVGRVSTGPMAPGPQAVLREPINMLTSAVMGGRKALVFGGDRMARRGLEGGALLAEWRYGTMPSRVLEVTRYRSAGIFGAYTFAQWQRNGVNHTAAGSEGAANTLTNHPKLVTNLNDQFEDYSFLENNPVDATVATEITPSAGASTTSFVTTTISGRANDDYEHYILIVTTAGNLALGDYRRVSQFTGGASNSTFVTRAWSAAPNTSVRFRLIRPPKRFRFYGERTRARNALEYRHTSIPVQPDDVIPSVTATTVILENSDPDSLQTSAVDNTAHPVHLQLTDELRWGVPSGRRWSTVYDTVTRKLLMTNGESGILEYDGEILQPLLADTSSALAQQLAGKIADEKEIISGADPTVTARSHFRSQPPNGRFLALWRGILISAGSTTYPYTIWNSAPGVANNIWPLAFEAQIRDFTGEPITGLASLYDRIYAFTRASIHEGILNEDGSLSFNPISQGIGFTAHHAVVQVPHGGNLLLAGPGLDGIYATNGQEPTPVLSDWEMLIEGGINTRNLDKAVGAVVRSKNLAFFAVASKGSLVNDRIIVWDYMAGTWWVWRHSIGVSALTSVLIGTVETLAIGTDDGVVQLLWNVPDDDGATITGDAMSAPEQPAGPTELAYTRLNLTMRAMGGTQTVDVDVYMNEREVGGQGTSISFPVTTGQASFGTAVMGTSTYASDQLKSFTVNLARNVRGTIVQYRIRGSSRWRLRQVSIEAEPKSSRGQR